MGEAPITVIIRARDEAGAIGRCLELLAAQRVDARVDVIVVDNASTDETAEIARRGGADVIPIGRYAFSFGRALNLGAKRARGEVVVALSAHAFLRDSLWLSRLAGIVETPGVACACGDRFGPDGEPLPAAVRYDAALAEREPTWGYSNAAGAFRASLWRERPFREDLPGCEDKEWGRHWALQGWACVIDPTLVVEHDHTHDPVLQIYRRARREAAGFAMFLPPSSARPASVRDAAAEWWGDTRFYANPWRARLSHRRLARIAGAYVGSRVAGRPGVPPGRGSGRKSPVIGDNVDQTPGSRRSRRGL